jgi:hypothetical protein
LQLNQPKVLREVESRFALGVGFLLGVGLLSASFLGVELWDELLVAGWACSAGSVWLFVRGGRELTVDASRITVTRKGKVRLSRPLSSVLTTTSLPVHVHWLTFADGARLFWLCPSHDWQPIADLLLSQGHRPASWVRRGKWSRLDCALPSLRFPRQSCIGCERPAVCTATLTASRGLSLILFEAVVERDIPVPCCSRCRRSRRALTLVKWLPGCSLLGFMFAQISLRIPPPAAYWIAGPLLFSQLVLLNFGDRLCDRLAFGVHVRRFAPTLAHASLVFRNVERGQQVARLSGVHVD